MIRKVSYLFFVVAFCSCAREKPDIHVACELTQAGAYLIKWETFPQMDGVVKIYESSSPDSFNLAAPVTEQSIKTGYQTVLSMPGIARPYFKLVFNKEHSVITADRIVPMTSIPNFRDMGGYQNKDRQAVKWGKLYISSSLASANRYDVYILHQLGIKTIVDFRTERDSYNHPVRFQSEQVFNFPLRGNIYNIFLDRVLSQQMKRSDAIVYQQDLFTFHLEYNADYFAKMFDVLLNESNYPLVFFSYLGNDRAAVAALLILSALDIDRETIINDYMLSNDLIDYHSVVRNSELYSIEIQEAITALYSANRDIITCSLDRIDKDYGSMQNYLEQELKLTSKKREKLREILLHK